MNLPPPPSKGSDLGELIDKSLSDGTVRAPGNKHSAQDAVTETPPSENPGNEEPALVLEPDLPSDGRDEVGEAMIRALPRQTESAEPPDQPDLPKLQP